MTSQPRTAGAPSARNPWSTEPELPPDAGDLTPSAALTDLKRTTHNLISELTAELDTLRPLLAVEPSAEGRYVSAAHRLTAAEQTARDVDAALERVEDGTYGFCAACTSPIPAGRLELLPHTRYCVPCG